VYCHYNNPVHLRMSCIICEIFVVIDFELLVGVLDESESHVFDTADSQIN